MGINKPFDQLVAADIAELCEHGGAYESLTLEFKRELSSRDGKLPDRWMRGDDSFSEHARDALFREIVAFANARGGTLVLGIAEAKGNPPRASAIMPIPRVHNLAARLADAARACIEPPLGGLQIIGIVTEGAADGVVVFRTVASAFGPHRVAGDGHAFIRRGGSSVKMTMREIQDLTIDLARGADRLEALFKNRATDFGKWFDRPPPVNTTGLRVTAAPVGALPQMIKVPRRTDVPLSTHQIVEFEGGHRFEIGVPVLRMVTRPILRGWRGFAEHEERVTQIDVLDGGVIDLLVWVAHTGRDTKLPSDVAFSPDHS